MAERLFLLDGVSYAYRAFYAIQRLSNADGFPTNAVFGFVRTLRKLIADLAPERLVAVFDPKGPTFRSKRFADYKITRRPMPEDLVVQMPVIKEWLEAMGIPVVEVEGYEADDAIGTLARRAEAAGFEVYIVSGDKDMLQLVSDKVRALHAHKDNAVLGPDEVVERFGVPPDKVTDVLGLAGDTSDNVPGVPGIGEKTATALVQQFGGLEEVLAHPGEVSGAKRQENLRASADLARLSKELVTIRTDVPIELDLDKAKLGAPDAERLSRLYARLEFHQLRDELVERTDTTDVDYRLVNDTEALAALVKALEGVEELAVDVETTSTDAFRAELVGISLAFAPKQAFYVPLNGALEPRAVLDALRPVLSDPARRLVGQNIKYDMEVLAGAGIELGRVAFDTMVAAYLVNPARGRYKLDDLAIEHLGIKKIPIEDLIGSGKNQRSMADVPLEEVARYSCEDADTTLRLKGLLEPHLREAALLELFDEIEMPLVGVLAAMEARGVAVDTALLGAMSAEFQKRLDALAREIYEQAEESFNLNSPKQLSVILFDKLGLPVQKRTKTGPSTDVEVLEKLAQLHPLPQALLQYRQLAKLKSTYVDALPALVNPKTGRIHTSFNQTIAATGRLSSSSPNLQNIPVRTDEGRRIRDAFVPGEPGWLLLAADYSQIELRIFAHLAHEEAMIEAFRRGEDIHAVTASHIHEVALEDVTPDMRHRAKTVNFGIIYGQGAYGLSQFLHVPVGEAQAFIDAYMTRYEGVRAYMDNTVAAAERDGYVETICKRRRSVPELRSASNQTRALGRRIAINTPIQGSAADLIKIAMIRIERRLSEAALKTRMLLQIHDELIFEMPENEADAARALVVGEMESVMTLSVPLKVDVKTGRTWGEA
ncbi:MAG: DNA polymerase I [Verrucomicrobia bacterium]|nr:DNA polymerase I [Verrucomicrobiota bacterium]